MNPMNMNAFQLAPRFCLRFLGLVMLLIGLGTTTLLPAQSMGGLNTSLVICLDSTVWGSGMNYNGQLGTGSTFPSLTAVQASGPDSIIGVAGGSNHSILLDADGTVWAAGSNYYGQLGIPAVPANQNAVYFQKIPNLNNVVQIDAGYYYSAALKSDGTIWTWGNGGNGVLGHGNTNNLTVPTQITTINNVAKISCGYFHMMALRNNGTLYTWGSNNYGQLGTPGISVRYGPDRIDSSYSWIDIGGASTHSLAIRSNQTLWSWGRNDFGQTGLIAGSVVELPAQVPGVSGVIAASAGQNHSYALTNWGQVLACGDNAAGQLGNGNTNSSTSFIPVPGLGNIVEIYAGRVFGLAKRTDGLVLIWGNGGDGVLGNGSQLDVRIPEPYSPACLLPAVIEGVVYDDANGNCQRDAGEPPLENVILQAEGGLTFYGSTDSNGYYQLPISTGQFDLSIAPSNGYWEASSCALDTVPVNVSTVNSQLSVDFPREPIVRCADMEVNLLATTLRPCRAAQYFVNYCNNGTDSAANATITIEFDSLFQPTSASVPWVTPQYGNVYTFHLGNVPYGDCGGFVVMGDVSCSAMMGEGVCAKAEIKPDSFCIVDPRWDGAHIVVDATCSNTDSVRFVIVNRGQSMTGSGNLVVLEDNLMRMFQSFSLAANDSIIVKFKANGSTWCLQADQVDFHPGNSNPSICIEGCGTNGQGQFSTGFLTNLPLDDQDDFVDIECNQIRTSFDPNDKTSEPRGVDAPKYIKDVDDLEYKIRFQNTGNDTAFNIVLRDTLSPRLNPATFQTGASSHPYTWTLRGQGIIEFRFDNILLPDSNVNEPASHGYVNFGVEQVEGNEPGTVIENQVAIYFDYNEPVLTNIEFNTVEEDFIDTLLIDTILQGVGEVFPDAQSVKTYPNPMRDHLTIEADFSHAGTYRFLLFDGLGQEIRNVAISHRGKWKLEGSGLESGLYYYRIEWEGVAVASGKVVAQ